MSGNIKQGRLGFRLGFPRLRVPAKYVSPSLAPRGSQLARGVRLWEPRGCPEVREMQFAPADQQQIRVVTGASPVISGEWYYPGSPWALWLPPVSEHQSYCKAGAQRLFVSRAGLPLGGAASG